MPDKSLYDSFNTLFNCYMTECEGIDCEGCAFYVKDPVGVMLSALSFISNSKWTPVSEKMPDYPGDYLVTIEAEYDDGVKDHLTGIASYGKYTGWYEITPWYGKVVAWALLPESWKGEEK